MVDAEQRRGREGQAAAEVRPSGPAFVEEPSGEEAVRLDLGRRRFLTVVSVIGIPLAVVFMGINYARGMTVLVVGDAVLAALLGVNLVLVRRAKRVFLPALLALTALTAFLVITMRQGVVQGYLWCYVVPGIAFFMVGVRRGLILNAVFTSVLIAAVLIWPPYKIAGHIEISILMSFAFVMGIAYVFEMTRSDYERSLRSLSRTDAMTGIGNRRHFEQVLATECFRVARYGRPLSVILFDVDHFKSVNDRFGHDTGDKLLCAVVDLTRGLLRETDVFARLGGDEFVVLLPETPIGTLEGGMGGASVVAERLRAAVAARDFKIPQRISLTVGVAQLVLPESGERMLRRADEALYRAKRAGRNRVELDPTGDRDGEPHHP